MRELEAKVINEILIVAEDLIAANNPYKSLVVTATLRANINSNPDSWLDQYEFFVEMHQKEEKVDVQRYDD